MRYRPIPGRVTHGVNQMATRNKRAKLTYVKDDAGERIVGLQVEPCDATGNLDGRKAIFKLADYSPQIQDLLTFHTGFNHKFMDSWSDPADDVLAAAGSVHDQLIAGNWHARGTGEAAEKTSLFVEAYARHTFKAPGQGHDRGMTAEDWLADVRKRINEIEAGDDDAKKAHVKSWKSHSQIKLIEAQIKEEKAKAAAKMAREKAKDAKPAEMTML